MRGLVDVKKNLLFIVTLIMLFLAACGNNEVDVSEVDSKPKDEKQTKENEDKEEIQEEGKLTEVGQVINDKDMGATVELLKIIETDETLDLDPIKITLDDIKIIHMSDIKNSEFKRYLSQFTDKEEFDYIQMNYSMENTVDENVEMHSPIDYIVFDTGEQLDVTMNDVALDPDNGGQFFGKVTKESGVFVLIENSNVDDISEIKLITGDVWEADGQQITDKIEKEFSFE